LDQETAKRPRDHRGIYRVISLLLLPFFISPTDPVFLLLMPVGVFFWILGGSTGIKLTGAVIALLALVFIAPWEDGIFLVIYVCGASVAAAQLSSSWSDRGECTNYIIASFAGSAVTLLYIAAAGWQEFTGFEEALTSKLLENGKVGIDSGLYSVFETNQGAPLEWLETFVGIFVHLYPGLLVLATVIACYLAATLLRISSNEGGSLPKEEGLSEFRFNDQLIWLLVGGIVLFIAPLPGTIRRIGGNMAFVMGMLVMVRGVGIWVYYMGRRFASPLMKGLIVLVVFLLFPPVAAGLALVVGLTDIWLDVRNFEHGKGVV